MNKHHFSECELVEEPHCLSDHWTNVQSGGPHVSLASCDKVNVAIFYSQDMQYWELNRYWWSSNQLFRPWGFGLGSRFQLWNDSTCWHNVCYESGWFPDPFLFYFICVWTWFNSVCSVPQCFSLCSSAPPPPNWSSSSSQVFVIHFLSISTLYSVFCLHFSVGPLCCVHSVLFVLYVHHAFMQEDFSCHVNFL